MAFHKAKALQEAEKLVSQGKTSQAIKHYLNILENDPADLTLLNTVGDLYVREKNIPEALKQFHKLADSYVQEGFTVKAIAIYKKVAKFDPTGVETLLKLAELYQVQGLGREAREQYAQAVEFYKKKNQTDKALEVLQKIVQLDPENIASRTRLAMFCEEAGRKADAAQAYVEAAARALRRGDPASAEPALKKALELDPKNPKLPLLRARLALDNQKPEEAEKILSAAPGLSSDPAARQMLLDAYLAAHKMEAAQKLLLAVYRADPADFTPLASFASLCCDKGEYDTALKPLAEVADGLIEQKNTAALVESLRQIWTKAPQHIPTLELIHKICERTADEFTLPEILEALGHAYVQRGDLEKAEKAYEKLSKREPENEQYKGLLKQVLQKQGKEPVVPKPAELSAAEMALTPEVEASAAGAPAAADAEQAAMVKEALENSDLFSRYGLVDKAVGELEKVLAVYPAQIDIHKRIVEICQQSQPAKAAQTAEALARILLERGEAAGAKRYSDVARQCGGGVAAPAGFPGAPAPAAEIGLTTDFPFGEETPAVAQQEEAASPPAQEFSLHVASSPAAEPPAAGAPTAEEIDLSGDWNALAPPAEAAPAVQEAPTFSYEESREEINFYLQQGFADEAGKSVSALEAKFSGNPQVAMLRRLVEEAARTGAAAAPPREVAEPAPEEWELPSAFAETPPPAPEPPPLEVPPRVAREAAPRTPAAGPAPLIAEPAAVGGGDLLGDLAGDFASSLEGLAQGAPPPTPAAQPPPRAAAGPASPLSGLLDELGEPAEEKAEKEDPETHYNLGVAFREMSLLDEAIGEFQKIVKGARKGSYPEHFLQACSLLAVCFMDKKMPAIATKWYLRALETPGLDEEATLALQYDLGVAYEQAGDARTALEKFTEVYSQNIDFRDVAEKIRLLQQRIS